MAAAVIEFDPLSDPVGAAAEDHDLLFVRDANLIFSERRSAGGRVGVVGRLRIDRLEWNLVCGVIIRRPRFELGGAGVYQLVHRTYAVHRARVAARCMSDLRIAVAQPLRVSKPAVAQDGVLGFHEFAHLREKPRVDSRQFVDLIQTPTHLHGVADVVRSPLARTGELVAQDISRDGPRLSVVLFRIRRRLGGRYTP